jgi:CRISPR-associated endonuclease Csn1
LTDTAYAAREVRKYLEGALYKDDTSGPQKVFFTKGLYTALLRKQWQLQDEKLGKNRADHRHHAIDAVAIGMTTPAVLQQLSRQAAELECRPASPQQAQPAPISPPWGTVESFRSEVIDAASVQIVSHRPHKRGLVGAFHKDTLYGPVFDKDGTLSEDLFTSRIAVTDLKPKHLRMPKDSEDLQRIVLDAAATRHKRQWAWRRMLTLPDPRPGKSGLVRDPELRWELRCLLRKAQLDPDSFTSKQVETLVSGGALCKSSGVPIRTVVLLWALPTSISIAGKERDVDTGDYQPSKDPRRLRTYQGQNNHHMEVRCDAKGRWSGRLVTAFEAAQRVRSSADQTHAPDPVDRAESEEGRFVMSLSGGETLHMRHPETESDGFFVVVKLDKAVHLVRHWDARPAGATDRMEARAMYSVPVSKLKALAPAGHEAPYKVRVDPLGELTPVEGD